MMEATPASPEDSIVELLGTVGGPHDQHLVFTRPGHLHRKTAVTLMMGTAFIS